MSHSKVQNDEMPSKEINPGNALQRIEECMKYMSLQQWSKFNFLYPLLKKFQDIRVKGAGKILRNDDEFTCAWNKLRANAVNTLLNNMDSAQTFDEFLGWIDRLSEIVTDQRCLWNILHTEVQPSIKVTLEQSIKIATKFFSAETLFNFGFDSFINSRLVDFTEVKTESDIIDIFYATAGFMRGCTLDKDFIVSGNQATELNEIVNKMLTLFISIPDFNANRFIWLIETISTNLHMKESDLKTICENVIKSYATKNDPDEHPLTKLQKMTIISTSPFIQSIPSISDHVSKTFRNAAQSQRKFVHKYIFGSYINMMWTEKSPQKVSDSIIEWKLYISNLTGKITESQIPTLLLSDILDNSLTYFIGYYGEVQPIKEMAVNLRMDIFAIVDTCEKFYPDQKNWPKDTLRQIWYLLYIAAFCGAKDDDLKDIKYAESKEDGTPFLGLKHTETDFDDYHLAIGVLGKKFESENEIFPQMIEFIRAYYDKPPE